MTTVETFTTILLLPDYLRQDGLETFVKTEPHTTAERAIFCAQLAASVAYGGHDDMEDFALIACLSIVKPGRRSAIIFNLPPEAAP